MILQLVYLISASPGLTGLTVLCRHPGVLQVHIMQLLKLAVGGAPNVIGVLNLERILALQHSLGGVLSI